MERASDVKVVDWRCVYFTFGDDVIERMRTDAIFKKSAPPKRSRVHWEGTNLFRRSE